jgi:hypothetical protein
MHYNDNLDVRRKLMFEFECGVRFCTFAKQTFHPKAVSVGEEQILEIESNLQFVHWKPSI